MKGEEQQRIFYKGSNSKINAFITFTYPLIKIKFKKVNLEPAAMIS
jgi:hypothetical protein